MTSDNVLVDRTVLLEHQKLTRAILAIHAILVATRLLGALLRLCQNRKVHRQPRNSGFYNAGATKYDGAIRGWGLLRIQTSLTTGPEVGIGIDHFIFSILGGANARSGGSIRFQA